jgi:cobalt-zinc-cadmium efflux system membrane fusion protein
MTQVMIERAASRSAANPADRCAEQPAETRDGSGRAGRLTRLAKHTPALCVMAALIGLGVYGHRTHWKLPKFSKLIGEFAVAQDDWCGEHGVPESQCVECHPDLLPRGTDYGWCQTHGVHNCPLDHPDVAQLKKPPAVTEADRQRAASALTERARPDNNAVCKNYRRRIQFASLAAVK